MRFTIHRFYFAWDFEKEEKWLNEMSAKGFLLVNVGFSKYVFEDNHQEPYIYRLELLNNTPSHFESTSYIRFLEETGVEYIGAVFRWAYFRKKAQDGVFELYSDIQSKIAHYKRINFLFMAMMPLQLVNGMNMFTQYAAWKQSTRLWLGILCWTIFGLFGIGVYKNLKRIRRLKKDKFLRE